MLVPNALGAEKVGASQPQVSGPKSGFRWTGCRRVWIRLGSRRVCNISILGRLLVSCVAEAQTVSDVLRLDN